MKLTPRQIQVIRLMAFEGWNLGIDRGYDGQVWMQKGGLGKGGETRKIHSGTFHGLSQKGLVKSCEYHFPTTEWELTALGRQEAEKVRE